MNHSPATQTRPQPKHDQIRKCPPPYVLKKIQRWPYNPSYAPRLRKRTPSPLPTDLSILRDNALGRLLVDPAEVIAQVQKLETHALSPNPTLPHGAPFPWHLRVPPNHKHTAPIISGCITPAFMQEALRRTPNHKVAGPDGVPGMILKHMPPGSHEDLHLLFQAISITGITPLRGSTSTPFSSTKRGTPPHWTTTVQSP